jgi:hypothetical protein
MHVLSYRAAIMLASKPFLSLFLVQEVAAETNFHIHNHVYGGPSGFLFVCFLREDLAMYPRLASNS